MRKKILSMLLVLCMVFTMMPISAMAASIDVFVGATNVVNGDNITYWVNDDTTGGIKSEEANEGNYNVKFDPNGGTPTLTLNNASITEAYVYTTVHPSNKASIYATGNLSLVLEGSSTVGGSPSLDTNDGYSSGVHVNGNLNISGTGSITATGGSIDKNTSYQSSGISSNNNTVTISSGTITAIGGTTTQSAASYGIYSSVLVNGGTLNATGGTSGQNTSGISGNNFAMDGGTVIATGGSGGQYSLGINAVNNFNVSGGNVTAISHTAGTRAVNKAPNLTSYPNVQITASTNANGSEESVIDNTTLVNNINTYKYLKFEPIHQLLLSFDSQGGSPVGSLEVAHGNTITAPTAPTKYGYTFEGWYKDAAGTNQWNFATDSVTEATTLYAKWNIKQYTVAFDSQGGSPVDDVRTADYSLISAPIAPTKEGYTFGGWYKEATCVNEWNFEVDRIIRSITLYAKWIRIASENADLSNLALSNGILSPVFDSNTTSYSVSVVNSSTNVTITPTVVDSTATITVNGDPVASGNPSGVINLNVGANTITVVVTAEDGSTKTYTIEITRQASIVPSPQNPPSGGGGGRSSSDNSSPVIVILPPRNMPNSPTQGEIKVLGTVDDKGNITVKITDKTVTDAFEKALADAKKNGHEQNGITVVLRVDTGNNTDTNVTVNLPKTVQDTIIAKKIVNIIVVIDNPDISISMDLATVKEINQQAKSDVNITATRRDNGKLTGEAKNVIGSRPVFDLKVNYGSHQQVQSFGAGSVSITIPYTLGPNEKAENVQAVYVDSNGKVHWLVNSVYDSVNKVLRFSTNHFSTYGVGYKQQDTAFTTAFTDIAGHWAKEDIEFVVSRGFFSGTSDTTFSPNTAMTRGMFVTVLGRLANADVSGYKQSSFIDVKSDAYYMQYIEWASKNSIAKGTGNGVFSPEQSITREQMAVIMENYAKVMGFTMPKVHEGNTFADSTKISGYAKDAVQEMQVSGVISGKKGNLFDPQGTATRAEVSAVLRRFVELTSSSDTM